MSKRGFGVVSITALLAVCSTAMAVGDGVGLPAPTGELLAMYPGARVHTDGARIVSFYGMPMTPGVDARAAANAWIAMHGAAFGCGPLELTEQWSTPTRNGRFTVLSFGQSITGIPVELGDLRVMVLEGPVPRVVYAGGNLAALPENLNAMRIDGAVAAAMARAHPEAKGLTQFGKPELVVFHGDGDWVAPSVAWKVSATGPDPEASRTLFLNAGTGQVIHVRSDVSHTDVTGSVMAWRSPGTYPDASYNPPALMPMPNVRVSVVGGGNAFTGAAGLFSIFNPGTVAVTVGTGVNFGAGGGGQWSNVVPRVSAPITASLNGLPSAPFDLVLNPVPSEEMTAQVNALANATITHNHFKSRAPGFNGLDMAITTNTEALNFSTGQPGYCNAFYSSGGGHSINFYNSGGGCPNTAYSSVVAHEYGHFIVNRLGRSQGAFGEGFGDSMGILIFDDPMVGRGWSGSQGSVLRNPLGANIQYPCSGSCGGAIHCCGQQLGALWSRTRSNLGSALGSQAGLEEARDLHVAWALITAGGPNGSNAIGPNTAIEVLTADDTDGNISNGTPNYGQICAAFASGGITCPALIPISFTYPAGRPASVTPGQATQILVNVEGNTLSPQPGTGTVTYRLGSGAFATAAMTQTAPNEYTATIPAAACAQTIEYYFSVQSTTASSHSDPLNAPASFFSAGATQGVSTVVIATENFQTSPAGWAVSNTAVSTGAWERADPHTPASNGCPSVDADGSGLCWVTDNRAGDNPNFDVDGGPTVLTTGTYDLGAYSLVDVSFSRWLSSVNGVPDSMLFQYSANNGASWTTLETAPQAGSVWVPRTFPIANPSAQSRFRWIVSDSPSDSVTEAGIDAFAIEGYVCAAACYANCDGSTSAPILNVADFTCFLQRFAAGESYANCDGSTAAPTLNVADFTCFLQTFASGCP